MSIKTADKIHADAVKARDNWICQYCLQPINKYTSLEFFDCSHFRKRSRYQTRWSMRNCVSAHRECHNEYELDPKKHTKFWVDRIGQNVVDELIQLSNAPLPTFKSFYGSREHLKELRERKYHE